MADRYFCPVCQGNRTSFQLIYKMAREIRKDAATGEIVYASADLEVVARGDRPDLEVRCLSCGYTGFEGIFIKAAERDRPPALPKR